MHYFSEDLPYPKKILYSEGDIALYSHPFYLHTVTIVRQVEKCLDEVEAAPGEDLLVLEVWLHLEDLCCGGVTLLLSEAENVRIS